MTPPPKPPHPPQGMARLMVPLPRTSARTTHISAYVHTQTDAVHSLHRMLSSTHTPSIATWPPRPCPPPRSEPALRRAPHPFFHACAAQATPKATPPPAAAKAAPVTPRTTRASAAAAVTGPAVDAEDVASPKGRAKRTPRV